MFGKYRQKTAGKIVSLSFHDKIFIKPVFGCKQELRRHVQTSFGTYIIALATEDTLCDPYPDSLCFRDELNGICRTNPDTYLTPDTGIPVMRRSFPCTGRRWNWWIYRRISCLYCL